MIIPKTVLDMVHVVYANNLYNDTDKHLATDKNGNLMVPLSTTLTARNGLRSNYAEKFLIIGGVTKHDTTEWKASDVFEGKQEEYGYVVETKEKQTGRLTLNGVATPEFQNVVNAHASEIALMRMNQ